MPDINIAIAICIAYLIGSLSSAIIACKIMQLPDPRTQGSGNPGATNVLRSGSKKAAIFALLGDSLKGFIPVLIAKWLGFSITIQAGIALAAVLGHLFPIFFQFKGGKGVATMIGSLLALAWQAGLAWLGTWLFVAILSRYSSLAAITASLLAPLYTWYFTQNIHATLIIAVMSMLIIIRHHRNIRKLLKGQESKIGKKH